MGRPDMHTLEVTHDELKLLLSGLGLEQDRWIQRARRRSDTAQWPAITIARACEDLKEKLMHHAKRGRDKQRAGSSFTDYQAERAKSQP